MAIKSLFAVLGMVGALIVSSEAHATTCTSTTCSGTIKKLVLNSQANMSPVTAPLTHAVELDQDIAPTSGCTLSGGKYWIFKSSDQDLVKALLANYLAGKPVSFRKDDSQTTCTIIYASFE